MSRTQEDYLSQATEEAIDHLEARIDEIVDTLVDDIEVNEDNIDLDGLGGQFDCTLKQAVQVLEDLEEYEEGDDALWEGADPKDALIIMASYTYQNAVEQITRDLLQEISEDETVQQVLDDISYVETSDDPDKLSRVEADDPEATQEKILERLKRSLQRRVEDVLKESR